MTQILKSPLVVKAGFIYSLFLALCITQEWYMAALIPLVLAALYLAFFRLNVLMLLVVAATPLSVNLEESIPGNLGVYLPTEPLLAGATLLCLLLAIQGRFFSPRLIKHPISIIILLSIAWTFLSTVTSELPIVSLKFLIARLWFVIPVFFLGVMLLSAKKYLWIFLWTYISTLCIVVVYTVLHHMQYGFSMEAGHWVMSPFFKDHTSYGAVLAMFLPVNIALLLSRRIGPLGKVLLSISLGILALGIVLSYTRAAWLSLIAAAILLVLILLKFRLTTLLVIFLSLGGFFFMAQDQILINLERNQQESSDDLAEHVESISNVSSDASNLERLNRWNCAISLFKDRPITGWGPGTYQFVYAPFQRAKDRTIISTNNADGGNAHSEYLGPLAEQGFPGMLLVIALVLSISSLAFRLYKELEDRELKLIAVSCYLGLFTYMVHGILNNYLDTDKASIPFWGFTAVLVAIDLWHNNQKNRQVSKAVSSM